MGTTLLLPSNEQEKQSVCQIAEQAEESRPHFALAVGKTNSTIPTVEFMVLPH